ncbi:MAG: hypothetical protein COA78_19680 [Blastopirellula sp.]|nr:MAG: hypothetical protein COA78_19680 [Blastopirellula sp.]
MQHFGLQQRAFNLENRLEQQLRTFLQQDFGAQQLGSGAQQAGSGAAQAGSGAAQAGSGAQQLGSGEQQRERQAASLALSLLNKLQQRGLQHDFGAQQAGSGAQQLGSGAQQAGSGAAHDGSAPQQPLLKLNNAASALEAATA